MVYSKNNGFQGYGKVITSLPEADIPFEGAKAWILQEETHQLVFFQWEANTRAPEHTHDYTQWGMMIEGEMELTIGDKTRNYRKGDEYLIPPKVKHKAHFLTKSRVIDLFSERARYRAKTPP